MPKAKRRKRKYGLFEKQGGKWVRISESLSFYRPTAVRVFQNALLAGAFGMAPERKLKPVD